MVHIFTGIVHKKKSTIYLEANTPYISIHSSYGYWSWTFWILPRPKTPPEVQKIDGIDPWLCSCSPGKWGSLEQWDRCSVGFRIYPCEPRKRAPACFGFIEDYLTWLCGDSDKMEVPHLDFPRHASPSWKKRLCDVIEVRRQQTYQACQSKIEQQIQKRRFDWVLWMKAMKFLKSFLYLPKWWISNVWHKELSIILILTLYAFSWANH